MCYFLLFAVPRPLPVKVFPLPLVLEAASSHGLGQAVLGGARGRSIAYLLTEGGCSCSIVGRCRSKAAYGPQQFVESITNLLELLPSTSILLHDSRGDWRSESVP